LAGSQLPASEQGQARELPGASKPSGLGASNAIRTTCWPATRIGRMSAAR
jgi:hypothetical protein